MSILITGGAGFIGSNFVLDWLERGDETVVNLDALTYAGNLDNLTALKDDPRHVFVRGDIGDAALVTDLLRQWRPRAVLHLAAESHVDRSILGPDAFIQTNVLGMYRLLQACLEHWRTLEGPERDGFRFMHVSTDEVYGSLAPDAPPFRETDPYAPSSPYSASKAASDHLVRAWRHTYGLPTLTTNCSNNYGPFQFPEKLIPLMIHNALSGLPLPIYGDGSPVRDWLYVGDHCAALRRVLEAGQIGETYHVGGGGEHSNLEVVHSLCTLLDELRPRADGRGYAEQIEFVADRLGHDYRYAMDASRIQRELGWRPRESFASGLRCTVTWYLEHDEWVARVTGGEYRQWVARNYGSAGRTL